MTSYSLCIAVLALCLLPVASKDITVDFTSPQRAWDGFGLNYVEACQTLNYTAWPQDYGGFSVMSSSTREKVMELFFGKDGLRPGLLKMFLDPFHEGYTIADNDNSNPFVLNLPGFDHTTTTKNMLYHAMEGYKMIKEWGGTLKVLAGMYGPAGWVTKERKIRSRDLDPARKFECGEYLVSWAKFLRSKGLPVHAVSLHNEGENGGPSRYPTRPGQDYDMYWPAEQIVEFLDFLRGMLDKDGLQDVLITPGETSNLQHLISYNISKAISENSVALKNLGLITSHGFGLDDLTAINMLRDKSNKGESLHVWITSDSFIQMKVPFVQHYISHIYNSDINGLIPWATIQRPSQWVKGDPNPGTTVIVNDDGTIKVTTGYYYLKQLSRAGQAGSQVVDVTPKDNTVAAWGSTSKTTKDAFVITNSNSASQEFNITIKGSGDHWIGTRSNDGGSEAYADIGSFVAQNNVIKYTAPAQSVTTFFRND